MLDIMGITRVVFLALLVLDLMLGSRARDFALVGYMPEWRHEGADFDRLSSHLSHLILFSAEVIHLEVKMIFLGVCLGIILGAHWRHFPVFCCSG